MAESGPARSERDKLRSHRAEKPYARRPQQLRRSASIVDSIKSIVVKPLSWLTGGPLNPATRESTDVSSSSSQPARLNGNYKRRASSPEETEPLQTPKKLRRLSPGGSSTAGSTTSSHLRTATSLPYLSAHSVGLRPPRASFLPPLPRTSTPSRQSSVEPTRFASPNVRASPSIGSTVFRRAGSLTPQASFDTGSDKTAFGIQYRSPFAPRASPAPASGSNGSYGGLPRQPSLLSDRGHAAFNGARSHSTVALDDDAETERGNSISPSRPTFTPLGSPVRRTSDATSVGGQLVSHLRLATLHGTESLNAFPTNVRSTPFLWLTFPHRLSTKTYFSSVPGPLIRVESLRSFKPTEPSPSSLLARLRQRNLRMIGCFRP
ncbi:hypothetical protein DL93DRAFT_460386 [Clavulina sp. PMI_390]|nr:hypothetical protein DL93DRAFT_460386 [Clavulina sp. PMI_390]